MPLYALIVVHLFCYDHVWTAVPGDSNRSESWNVLVHVRWYKHTFSNNAIELTQQLLDLNHQLEET